MKKELRIGNFFTSHIGIEGSWIERQRVSHLGMGKDIYECTSETFQYDKSSIFARIPLTKEWAEGFGWDNNDVHEFFGIFGLYFHDGKFCLGYVDQYCSRVFSLEIKWVHQLQNLYFELTGNHLKFKKK